jgi:pentatricopeptide repeat protein
MSEPAARIQLVEGGGMMELCPNPKEGQKRQRASQKDHFDFGISSPLEFYFTSGEKRRRRRLLLLSWLHPGSGMTRRRRFRLLVVLLYMSLLLLSFSGQSLTLNAKSFSRHHPFQQQQQQQHHQCDSSRTTTSTTTTVLFFSSSPRSSSSSSFERDKTMREKARKRHYIDSRFNSTTISPKRQPPAMAHRIHRTRVFTKWGSRYSRNSSSSTRMARASHAAVQFNKLLQQTIQEHNKGLLHQNGAQLAEDLLSQRIANATILIRMHQQQEPQSRTTKSSALTAATATNFTTKNDSSSLAQERYGDDCFCDVENYRYCSFDTVSVNIVMQAWARQHSISAAQHADDLLMLLLQLEQEQQQQSQPVLLLLQADSYSYAAVLHAYAKSGGKVAAAQRATELLSQMMMRMTTTTTVTAGTTPTPIRRRLLLDTDICHNAVMDAWAASGHCLAGHRALEVLKQLQTLGLLQSRISYNACIKAFARNGQAVQAQEILDIMKNQQLVADGNNALSSLSPDKVSYSTCIHAWAKVAAMQEKSKKQTRSSSSDGSSSSSSSSSSEEATSPAEKAEALLREMEQVYEQTRDESLRPDVVAYTSVLSAMTKSWSSSSRHHQQQQLQHQQQQHDKVMQLISRMEHYSGEKPNAAFFNAWIHWMSKTTIEDDSSAVVAERILRYMQSEYEKHLSRQQQLEHAPSVEFGTSSSSSSVNTAGRVNVCLLRPCKVTYTAVIAVLARVGTLDAAQKAHDLLNELESLWRTNNKDPAYMPNAKTFASVLNAWARCSAGTAAAASCFDDNEMVAVERADELLDRMDRLYEETGESKELRPNLIVFVQVFQILARLRDPKVAAVKSKELLQRMNRLYLAGGHDDVRPDSTTMAYFLNTLTKSGVSNAVELATHVIREVEEGYQAGMGHLKPTCLLYSAALQAYAKSASKAGAELAESLLQRTKQMYKEGKLYAKPTVLSYNAVIDAYARSSGGQAAAERAEALLDEMNSRSRAGDSELKPNTRSFNGVVLAWKNSNSTQAPHRAEALVKQMFERYKAGDGDCRPDRVTLNSVIGVWAKSRDEYALQRGEEFLHFMETHYLQNGDRGLQPDHCTYNSLVDAYARRGAGRQAHDLCERMEKVSGLKPDIITLTTLRNAWSKSIDADAKKEYDRVRRRIADYQSGGNDRRTLALTTSSGRNSSNTSLEESQREL